MTRPATLAERIRRGDPVPLPLAALLSAATPIVRLGMWRRLRQPATQVGAHVISMGNLTVGGTGKTPAVIERAQLEIQRGKRVAVLTRGYGTRGYGAKGMTVSSSAAGATGAAGCEGYPMLGDEPALMLARVPGLMAFQCADRVASARLAVEEHGCEVLILDDGFQYTRLARDENILVIDATCPFGNGSLLPRGVLREPIGAMGRATAVVLTRCDQAGDLDGLVEKVNLNCPGVPIRKTVHAPVALRRLKDGACLAVEGLRGKEVTAVCAIGNPESFVATLESLGAVVVQISAFRDHREFPPDAIPPAGAVIMTEKDAVRVRNPGDNVLALCIELRDFEEATVPK